MYFTVENQINRKLLVAARLRQSVLHHVVVEAHGVNHGASSRSLGCRRKFCHSIATRAIFGLEDSRLQLLCASPGVMGTFC